MSVPYTMFDDFVEDLNDENLGVVLERISYLTEFERHLLWAEFKHCLDERFGDMLRLACSLYFADKMEERKTDAT